MHYQDIKLLAEAATEAACAQFMDWEGKSGVIAPFGLKADVYFKVEEAMIARISEGE